MDEKDEMETRLIVIAPSSEITPDQITRFIHSLDLKISVKETCYGAMIEGKREVVREVLSKARKLDPNRIFSKIRAFPMGDTRRCRAHHGSRPGFPQLEKEWEMLTIVERGLSAVERGEEIDKRREKKERIPVERLKEIVEAGE